jgi:hypothetical protein
VDEDSEVDWDNWQEGKYGNFSRHSENVKSIKWIGVEIGNYLIYDDTSDLHSFLFDMEEKKIVDERV